MKQVELVWFDPGGVTGWCVVSAASAWVAGQGSGGWTRSGIGCSVNLRVLASGQTDCGAGQRTQLGSDELKGMSVCSQLLSDWERAAWGFEDFVVGSFNTTREFLTPVRVFSVLTFWDWQAHGRRPFVQLAAQAKGAATDARMKNVGLYRPGQGHATDALRHAVVFLLRCRARKELREAAWPEVYG
jgi:hypothetical protein